MALLEVQGITKRFGGLTAVGNFNLSLEKGHVVGLIGPNGAGKTTAFNVIAGFYKCDAGKVIFDGKDITGMRPDQICRLGLARTFQVVRPFRGITVLENVMVGAYARTNDTNTSPLQSSGSVGVLGDGPVGQSNGKWPADCWPQTAGDRSRPGNRSSINLCSMRRWRGCDRPRPMK